MVQFASFFWVFRVILELLKHGDSKRCSYKYTMKIKFKVNDIIMFKHDFNKQECEVYHNGKLISIIPVKQKYILPALSLCYIDELVEITKHKFY